MLMKGLPGWTQKQFKKEKKFLGLRVSTNDADWNKYGPFLRERKDISESGIKRPEGKAKDRSDDRLT